MQKHLYELFEKILETRDPALWETLSAEDKKELASLFIERAKKCDDEETLLNFLALAEEIGASEAEIFCQSAQILYQYSLLYRKEPLLLLALDKLMYVEEMSPSFLDAQFSWRQLWGNILVGLGTEVGDDRFFSAAIKQFDQAAKLVSDSDLKSRAHLYWDLGEAWKLLGRHSLEISDFQQAVAKLTEAARCGCDLPHFRIDCGDAFIQYALLKGDPELLKKACSLFYSAVSDARPTSPLAFAKGWLAYAKASIEMYKFTHKRDDLEKAEQILQETLFALPSEPKIWLYWAELYLHAGWVNRDIKWIDIALEKLTSSKIEECDPMIVASLLGQGIMYLGSMTEDWRLLRDGRQRIQAALKLNPSHPRLLYAEGMAFICHGFYFTQPSYFGRAALQFEKLIENGENQSEILFALFHAYFGCGDFHKAKETITRLCELRPFSAIYQHSRGVALLRLSQVEEASLQYVRDAIESFKKTYHLHENVETLHFLGRAYDFLGDLTLSEEAYKKAVAILAEVRAELGPKWPGITSSLAIALSHLGELAADVNVLLEAIDLFNAVVEKEPENEEIWCYYGYTLLNLAALYEEPVYPQRAEGFRCEAEKKLLRAAILGSRNALYHLACLYSICGLPLLSMRYLKKAESLDALPSIEELREDEWLANLRETDEFREFMIRSDG